MSGGGEEEVDSTHQNVLEFNVSVDEPEAVKVADPFDDVNRNLKSTNRKRFYEEVALLVVHWSPNGALPNNFDGLTCLFLPPNLHIGHAMILCYLWMTV